MTTVNGTGEGWFEALDFTSYDEYRVAASCEDGTEVVSDVAPLF